MPRICLRSLLRWIDRVAGVLLLISMAWLPPASSQGVRTAYTQLSACVGDTVRLEGSSYYITYDWKPNQFGRRDGRLFSFVAQKDQFIILASEPPIGPNLIRNYNLSEGFVDFASDYRETIPSTGEPGQLAVLADLRDFEPTWRDCPDVTRDGGPDLMLVARGNGDPTSAIYRSRVSFEKDSFYVLTFLATTTGVGGTPGGGTLGARIGGTPLQPVLRMPEFNCSWRQYNAVYQAPRAGDFDFEIVDRAARAGFGYAIDGVLVSKVEPARVDTFDVRVSKLDTAFAMTVDVCAGEIFQGQYFAARTDSTVCTRITRSGQCDSVFCESVRFAVAPNIARASTPPTCAGGSTGSLRLQVGSPSRPYTITWEDSDVNGPVREGLRAGTYVARLLSPEGCTRREEFVLADPAPLRWADVGFAADDCPDTGPSGLRVSASGGQGRVSYSYRQNEQAVDRTALVAGETVAITALDSVGCRADTTLVVPPVSMLDVLRIEVSGDTLGQAGLLSWAGGPPEVSTASWSLDGMQIGRGSTLPRPSMPGTVRLEVVAGSGCSWFAERRYGASHEEVLYFPNAFSPNGDEVNDIFWIVDRPDVERVERFEVYDRWGGLLFRRVDCPPSTMGGARPTCGWTGLAYDSTLETDTGVYVYYAELRLTDRALVSTSGVVQLFR